MIGDRQSRGSSNLSAGPIQNRKILVELDRKEPLIGSSHARASPGGRLGQSRCAIAVDEIAGHD